MSTSDSDYSIDWLASDDDDALGSLDGSDPRLTEEPWAPPSTSSLRGSPTSFCCCRATQRRRSKGGVTADSAQQTSPTRPAQGFTSIYAQPLVELRGRLSRKRAHSGGLDGLCEKAAGHSEDQLFSQKCLELQCYIQPLASILQGLRSGRYSERLSSFQESVAMDRIQRIMGVLQNPDMGGRFLTTIVKIEGMLQSWFPHIKATVSLTDNGVSAKRQKHHSSTSFSSSSRPALESLCSSDVELAHPTPNSSTHLKWLQVATVCSLKTHVETPSQHASSASPLPASCAQEVTQDNSVSSSTDCHGGPPRRLAAAPRPSRGPSPFKISSPCLERLLQAKESIIAPRVAGGGAWLL